MSNGSGSMAVDFGPTRPVVLWRWLPITEGEVGLACIRCFAPTQPYVAREPSARPGCVRMTADEAGKAPLPSLRHLFRSLPGRLRHAKGFPVTGDQQAALALLLPLLALLLSLGSWAPSAFAAPGICVGPVCGDGFQHSPQRPFQLRLRLSDQRGHHERITVDCRDGRISPAIGPVERGYGAAVARRVCRLQSGEVPPA